MTEYQYQEDQAAGSTVPVWSVKLTCQWFRPGDLIMITICKSQVKIPSKGNKTDQNMLMVDVIQCITRQGEQCAIVGLEIYSLSEQSNKTLKITNLINYFL